MSTINERLLKLRENLNLTRKAFGERLGVSDSVIKNIEYNVTDPKPLLIQQICKEFKVDRDWLETGEGEMFMPQTQDAAIIEFLSSVLSEEDESFKRRFVEMLSGLDDSGWIFLENTLRTLYPDKTNKKEQD